MTVLPEVEPTQSWGTYREIEHKFVVGDGFDLDAFRATAESLGPRRKTALVVRDTYYRLAGDGDLIYRHRFDEELQQLTVKSLADDPQVRLEVDLDLGHHRGDQRAAVEAFLGARGIAWRGELHKDIEVFYFGDCEVVYYRAWTGRRELAVVELEATHKPSLEEALATVYAYRRRLGLDGAERELRSLPQLLFPEAFPEQENPP